MYILLVWNSLASKKCIKKNEKMKSKKCTVEFPPKIFPRNFTCPSGKWGLEIIFWAQLENPLLAMVSRGHHTLISSLTCLSLWLVAIPLVILLSTCKWHSNINWEVLGLNPPSTQIVFFVSCLENTEQLTCCIQDAFDSADTCSVHQHAPYMNVVSVASMYVSEQGYTKTFKIYLLCTCIWFWSGYIILSSNLDPSNL